MMDEERAFRRELIALGKRMLERADQTNNWRLRVLGGILYTVVGTAAEEDDTSLKQLSILAAAFSAQQVQKLDRNPPWER